MAPHTCRFTVRDPLGLHARPAMALCEAAQAFSADIRVSSDNGFADGKSIMQLLQLAATCGSELVIEVEGPDAEPAIAAIRQLVDRELANPSGEQ